MHFGLVTIVIILFLRDSSQRSRRPYPEDCVKGVDISADTSDTSSDCEQTDSSDYKQNDRKIDNLVLIPYPVPIMVPPLVPMPPGALPPGCIHDPSCNNSVTTTTSEPWKCRDDVARCTEPSHRIFSPRKSMSFGDSVPQWLLKYGILPLPDSMALDLVNQMDAIQRRNSTRRMVPTTDAPYPVRQVDQSIYQTNPKSETNKFVDELKDLFSQNPDGVNKSDEESYASLIKTIKGRRNYVQNE